MDIFEYADQIGWAADYMDMTTGRIYCIQSAPNKDTILVKDYDGSIIGSVRRKHEEPKKKKEDRE